MNLSNSSRVRLIQNSIKINEVHWLSIILIITDSCYGGCNVVCVSIEKVWQDYRSLQISLVAQPKVHRPIRQGTERMGCENGVITQILISNARAEPSSEFTN